MATPRTKDNRSRQPQRRAFLVGINQYPTPFNSLKGCVNDALMMAQVLIQHFQFRPGDDMRMLTDARATKKEILSRLEWLVDGAKAGDVLVFHYSGHGAQVPDRDGDEIDHADECLCPFDFDWDDPLLDDDLGKVIDEVPAGVNLTIVLDCCHSGTGTRELRPEVQNVPRRLVPPPDIRFRAVEHISIDPTSVNRSVTMTKFRPLKVRRIGRQAGPGGILIAGCKDTQLSNDAWIDGDFHGALTYSLFKALNGKASAMSYADWVTGAAAILKTDFHFPDQDPQLEAADNLKAWKLFATEPAAARVAAIVPKAISHKKLVYVHGICVHQPGYSLPWWAALKPHVSSLTDADRLEVLWSDLVTAEARAAAKKTPQHEALANSIKDVLADRAQRELLRERLATAQGERPAEMAVPKALLGIPGLDCIDDFMKYLLNPGIRNQVIGRFHQVVGPLLEAGQEVEVVSHSWGTVVAYEALRRWDDKAFPGRVHNLFALGSALSIGPVQRRLETAEEPIAFRPALVRRWINLDAHGDIVGGPLADRFAVDAERLELDPVGCNRLFPSPACAHSSYFHEDNLAVNRDVLATFIEG